MEEKELKTSPKQRFFIILIAVIMLGSMIASYAAIVLNGSSGSSSDEDSSKISEEKTAEYEEAYEKKVAEFAEKTKDDYKKFVAYKSEVKAYNETSANEGGLKTKDLLEGSGEEVKEDGSNYMAYYVGWCADESVFDSSFDDNDNPTGFSRALDPSMGLIEGWTQGMKGVKIGGIRKITIPGELAYGDSKEICGGTNKPLKFIVMAVEKTDSLTKLSDELEEAYMKYQYAQYGIDYEQMQAGE
ncbi:FKBP-type peptidyl-prolyl cis-trans isomerase [Candidatus Saccharibacteria bacterium]|nr:FKBP-type peptidyl-prolyl cis-trans isomerase [Candidatus Saccharibacteria bacterium]